MLYLAADRYEEARDLLQLVVQLDPFVAQPYYDLGQVYVRLGERELGRAELEAFAQLEEEEKIVKSIEFTLLNELDKVWHHYDLGILYG